MEAREMTEEEANTPYIPEVSSMRIMDIEAGDLEIKWNRNNDDECKAAEEAFNRGKKKGMFFYKATKNRDGEAIAGEIIKEFDRSAQFIVGRPAVQGG